jgi:hypothetical protein
MFYLCLAYMNGAIDPIHFAALSSDLLVSAEKLITVEIPQLAIAQKGQSQPNGTPPGTSDDHSALPPTTPNPPTSPASTGPVTSPSAATSPASSAVVKPSSHTKDQEK